MKSTTIANLGGEPYRKMRLWLEEAERRLDDARSLRGRDRNSRAVSAAYYAVHAAGKGILIGSGIDIESHSALHKQLSYRFVKEGLLPKQTASQIQNLSSDRLSADYDLRRFGTPETDESISIAERLVEQMIALLPEE